MTTGSVGSSTVATKAAPLAVAPPVFIVTWAFVSRINCKLMFAVIAFWVCLPGNLASLGAINLVWEGLLREVLWAAHLSSCGRPSANWVEQRGDGPEI